MNYSICSGNDTTISFDFKDGAPQVVAVDSNVKEGCLYLNGNLEFMNALCIHLQGNKQAFTIPRCVTAAVDIPPETYFLLTRDLEGFTVYFCLSHQNMTASLSGSPRGIILNLKGDALDHSVEDSSSERNVLLCLKGEDLYETIRLAMKYALALTGGMGKLLQDKLPPPFWLDRLGWESGIALGSTVSHEGIIDAVKSLVDAGVPPGFVLIDEGWQHLEKKSLASFEADSVRFPHGIHGVIQDLKQLGVNHVGVWHGMMGSRGGVHSSLAQAYELSCNHEGRYFLGEDLGRTFEFFHDYYGYLREQGVDFIKVGDQSSVSSFCQSGEAVTRLYKHLQSALQAAASIQFNSAHFNTECLRNENLFYWGNSRIARAAEDIDISDILGAQQAIRNNLTNSLWLQHLMQPDFDAWLTCTDESEMLAIFHALSGSINVIGDPVGEHNKALIAKFVLPDGHLLKADFPLTLCSDAVFCDPLEEKKIYKAYTYKGEHGIIGAFNLAKGKRTLHGKVSAADVKGLDGRQFALFSHYNGFVKIVLADEPVPITLKPNQGDVFTFAPVHNGIAVLGCYPYFLSPGPLVEVHIEDDSMHISTLVSARVLVYCERQILEVKRNGKAVPWDYDEKRHILSIDSRAKITRGHTVYTITFE